MTDASLIALFVRPLNQLRIPYLVTAGIASVVYGEPRLTRDIDLVINGATLGCSPSWRGTRRWRCGRAAVSPAAHRPGQRNGR
jgi:hypothetical protein